MSGREEWLFLKSQKWLWVPRYVRTSIHAVLLIFYHFTYICYTRTVRTVLVQNILNGFYKCRECIFKCFWLTHHLFSCEYVRLSVCLLICLRAYQWFRVLFDLECLSITSCSNSNFHDHVYMYAYIHDYVDVFTYKCIYIYTCISIYIQIWIHTCIYKG